MMDFLFAGKTDIGSKRQCNEDYYKISESMRLAVLCDGMGGHECGDVASRLVVDTLMDVFSRLTEKQMEVLSDDNLKDIPVTAKRLYLSAQLTNHYLLQYIEAHRIKKGMGTTLVAVHFFKGFAFILHVGDSRCYRFRDGKLECLTKDHSYAQALYDEGSIDEAQLQNFDQKNIITRAFGMSDQLKMDIKIEKIQEGDVFLLCSDGLWGQVSDDRLLERMSTHNNRLEVLAAQLIQDAIDGGGDDNITVTISKNVSIGHIREDIIPCEFSMSVFLPNAEKDIQSVMSELFTKKRSLNFPLFFIAIVVLLGTGAYFLLKSPQQGPEEVLEFQSDNPDGPQVRKQTQKIMFLLDLEEDQTWRKLGQVYVDSVYCGMLSELENNGRLFEIGHHTFQIKVDSVFVYTGEFDCKIDPVGREYIVDIKTQ